MLAAPDISLISVLHDLGLVAVGGIVTIAGSLLSHNLAMKREREARLEASREAARTRQSEFQRKTLVDIQETAESARASLGLFIRLKIAMSQQTGVVPDHSKLERADTEVATSRLHLLKLMTRVDDLPVQELCKKLEAEIGRVASSDDAQVYLAKTLEIVKELEELYKLTGAALRSLDTEI